MLDFNPHLPCGRRLECPACNETVKIFQSTPSLRKATVEFKREGNIPVISIHTFLAEGDNLSGGLDTEKGISIHTFLAEGDYTHEN